ncbi:glycosyltransferase family 2 protein [Xanthocytophaga agilis]|uniref:Glycosyltransferase family 2 protein n=1 Tax=Xanthocytophaga agilis TaxID=3048010 RepID=A0AAE3RCF0_9BACT|nr:glycosyltransferase family 2 protein [Xanthocytophaga agilis]MDJ1505669.1 glycosyltransferase family 2 protein [Xanthocytophaga agilis]
MKPYVVGFTIARNAQKYDYPLVESIRSILPLCDEFVVSVGNSTDDTLKLVQSIQSDKIKIVHSVWDDSLQKGGKVLAVETDKAFDAVSQFADWAFYLQADEVVHEKYHANIRAAIEKYHTDQRVEGLLFNYKHFYGSYKYVGSSRRWYRHEIRLIRNNKHIRAYRDAQGFRLDGRKLNVKLIDAEIYHYGWVKNPVTMATKDKEVYKLWSADTSDNPSASTPIKQYISYDYSNIDVLEVFKDTHPAVMQQRIASVDWDFYWDTTKNQSKLSYRVLQFIEKLTGKRFFEYKNYSLLR